ncbi:RdgB/HAM1 family non-canonical purine NTP pyrophosphatase [Sulfuricurvum sp.]|uniref:RdgB/HAM1 family non-canonical purine NTP pyrophosphatase n=1 Tax=Sulfuricurvum sp. TaxID=2025608 RepID=UPI0025E96A98|nr:RdgB/HAM1 family non-canonical purine NTP pyrophosphatase [Sulfuricurvum sp.]
MKIVLATSNKGKVREIIELLHDREVFPYTDLIEGFEIVEDGESFKENALIKARAVYAALGDENAIVIADDSGISVDALDGAPGIYSARYGGEGASDRDNLLKLVEALKEKGLNISPAHYTAAIAIVSLEGESCVHGWMHGEVITELRGENGFGYDPIFIPGGFEKTLGELPNDVKKGLSHRSKALELAKILIDQIKFLRSHAGSVATK